MRRQHTTPILVPADGAPTLALAPLALSAGSDSVSEAAIQQLVHDHPSCLPVAEVDPMFANPVPICTELNTPAGPIDNFMVTPTGLPVLVECKLWRNPEGRREVIGQILDYAKELSRWSSSDLQRETARRLKRDGNAMLDLLRDAGHQIDEIEFNDALTHNLRRGRFLLLIVGDGIREGVEAIAEYLQAHAGLHFTFGLVELPIYHLPGGERMVVPRLLARTQMITRTVIAAPEGTTVLDEESGPPVGSDETLDPAAEERIRFLQSVVSGLVLDDPDQPVPRVTPKGYCYLYLPAPASSCWITVSYKPGVAGLYLTATTDTPGEQALQAIARDWDVVRKSLGGDVQLRLVKERRPVFEEYRPVVAANKEEVVAWLRGRVNDFVNVFRPLVRAAVQDAAQG